MACWPSEPAGSRPISPSRLEPLETFKKTQLAALRPLFSTESVATLAQFDLSFKQASVHNVGPIHVSCDPNQSQMMTSRSANLDNSNLNWSRFLLGVR